MMQFILLVLTLSAFLLSTARNSRLRICGPIIGIPAQFFWIASVNWEAQWGIGIVTVVYLLRYIHLAWCNSLRISPIL